MVFLQRSNASNPRKRAATGPQPVPRQAPRTPDEPLVDAMTSLLAEAGCTLRVPRGAPPSVSSDDPHKIRRHLEHRFGSDPALVPSFLYGFNSYIQSQSDLHRVLLPTSQDNRSLVRILLSVPAIQPQIQQMLLEKLPEHFNDTSTQECLSLKDDVARLIINQFRWLDFLVDPTGFAEKLMEVLSVAPSRMKREIVGLLPEILGDQCHCAVLPALEGLLNEDSELVVPVLDALSDLNLDEELQEQAITIAISCLRTVDLEHMPHLLRFLLLSANQTNVKRIILQIRDHLKFTGPTDPNSLRNKKLKGKCAVNSTDVAILDTLRSNLRFKNILCEAILRELKSIDKPQYHKAIDVWFLILIHSIGGTLQRSVEKMLKRKVVLECLQVALFDQCIHGHRELVKDHFASFLSVTEYLLSCKEDKARDFAIHLFMALFVEFCDIYSRQEILGILVTHIGSGVSHEVCSALDMMVLLTSKHSEELVPISSHINGILDYLEGFSEDNLRKVYDIFCHLALRGKSVKDTGTSSIGNELLMIVRKQVSNPDQKYRKMGIIGTLRVVRALGDAHFPGNFSSSQKSNGEEALELLRMAINSCKADVLPLILLYDELSALLERENLRSTIIDWIGIHAGEFESLFLADLEEGQLISKNISDGIEGELWMNLDGDLSPVCLNILPIVASSFEQNPSSLQVFPSQFTLLSVVERSTNQGSLGGIDALLGCPLHLPSPKCLDRVNWRKLSEKQRKMVCLSFYYAINWIRELLNAFSTQVGMVDFVTQKTKNEMAAKLLKRLRNLILLEGLLDGILQSDSLTLPELSYSAGNFHSRGTSKSFNPNPKKRGRKPKSENNKEKEVSDTPNPDGKYLKQPTIMDAFKKAGVSVSQELTNGSSSRVAPSNACSPELEADEIEIVDLSMAPVQLELQRCNFRPLLAGSFSLLAFSESCSSCCSDPQAELPLYLYLLRDLNIKLEKTQWELLISIRPLFGSFRRLVDNAFAMLRDGFESCPDHWQSTSTSSGNPEIPFVVVSKLSVASSLFREVLHCYRKMLSFPDIHLQTNLPILREMLEVLQPTEDVGLIFSEIQPSRILGNLDYLYGGAYMFLEAIIGEACSHSYLLALDIIETMQSVVSSLSTLVEKQFGGNEKNMNAECSQKILPFLRKRLGESAHKLLSYDPSNCKNEGDTPQNKGDIIQKLLRIYLQNCESTSDLLDHLAGSVLPQVPSGKTMDTQEMHHEFQTLSPSMFLTWYRSLHEENHGTLAKMVKEVIPKIRANSNEEAVKGLLDELHKLVNVLASLINMCRVHDKVVVHAVAVKYGGRFVDTFLKAFGFLKSHFEKNSNKIIEMVKGLQKATRLIQTICSEAKGSKRTMITTKIPATKKSLERLLFEVKALLHNNTTGRTFELGMLKHKDLSGQVVSSQVYSYGDDVDDDGNDDGHNTNDDHLELDAINEDDGMEVDQDANNDNSNQGDD